MIKIKIVENVVLTRMWVKLARIFLVRTEISKHLQRLFGIIYQNFILAIPLHVFTKIIHKIIHCSIVCNSKRVGTAWTHSHPQETSGIKYHIINIIGHYARLNYLRWNQTTSNASCYMDAVEWEQSEEQATTGCRRKKTKDTSTLTHMLDISERTHKNQCWRLPLRRGSQ